jgi:WXG100 family type VII secretion target
VVQAKPTADPGQLEQLASKIRQQAKRIEDSVDDLQRSSGSSSWKGHAASLFKQDVRNDHQDAQAAAGQLRSVADAIDRGAREVREYRAKIAKEQEEERKKASSGAPR